MFFEESYFEGEERCEFYVEPMMKRAWAAQLEVLQQIDEICKRHNIEYFADWGTLLGAIRHQGFIPWDDDLDIGMKRADYERFLEVASQELPQEYEVLTCTKNEGWESILTRIVNTLEMPLRGGRLQQFHGFPFMAGVDIFPIDFIPNEKEEEDTWLMLFSAVHKLGLAWDKGDKNDNMEALRLIEACCGVTFTEDKTYKHQLSMLANRIASMYWDVEDAKELTEVYRLVDDMNFRIPVSCYQSTIRVPFENTTIPVPIGYEQVLTAYFGEDYMTPKQMFEHDYPFYRKHQQEVIGLYEKEGIQVPEYLLG